MVLFVLGWDLILEWRTGTWRPCGSYTFVLSQQAHCQTSDLFGDMFLHGSQIPSHLNPFHSCKAEKLPIDR